MTRAVQEMTFLGEELGEVRFNNRHHDVHTGSSTLPPAAATNEGTDVTEYVASDKTKGNTARTNNIQGVRGQKGASMLLKADCYWLL